MVLPIPWNSESVEMEAGKRGYYKHLENQFERILAHKNHLKLSRKCQYISSRLIRLDSRISNEGVREEYLNELWLSELSPPPAVDTSALLVSVLNNEEEAFKLALKDMMPTFDDRKLEIWWLQMKNLNNAAATLFSSEHDNTPLTVEFSVQLHSMIAEGLFPSQFRTKNVKAGNSSVSYADHKVVNKQLNDLLTFVNKTKAEFNSDPFKMFCLAGFFFSEFLLIHPFIDGNGRTARLLLTHFLRGHSAVPVSLYLKSNRSVYISAMETRTNGLTLPMDVVEYVIDCIFKRSTRHATVIWVKKTLLHCLIL